MTPDLARIFGLFRPPCKTDARADGYRHLARHIQYAPMARNTCACRKSNPAVLMMEPAQDRKAKNAAGRQETVRRDDASLFRDRCVRVPLQ